MKVINVAPNQTDIHLSDGSVVFYSYSTPVAAFIPGRGVVITGYKHSKTTSKYINVFISRTCPNATKSMEDQSWFDGLVNVKRNY